MGVVTMSIDSICRRLCSSDLSRSNLHPRFSWTSSDTFKAWAFGEEPSSDARGFSVAKRVGAISKGMTDDEEIHKSSVCESKLAFLVDTLSVRMR